MAKLAFVLLFVVNLFAEVDFKTHNTNITLKEDSYFYNYDRLRFRLDWKDDAYFGTVIADGVNYLGQRYINSPSFSSKQLFRSNTFFETQTEYTEYKRGSAYAKLYRAYGGYEDADNRLVIGLQNISMGVGRIWQPTNIYNPKNIYALEPDETFGVAGVLYTRYLDETSQVSGVVSVDREEKLRYGFRYQVFLDGADVALDLLSSDEVNMAGYEIDGSIGSKGIGVRSEGAYFDTNNPDFFQGLIGADYGFENGVTLVVELLYTSKIFTPQEAEKNLNAAYLQNMVGSHYYSAISLQSPFTIYLDGSIVYIESFDGKRTRFLAPQINYTVNDYNKVSIGAMIYDGERGSETENLERYFFKWDLSF